MRRIIPLLLLVNIISCTHITYTPEQSAEVIQKLQQDKAQLIEMLEACESDLGSCMNLLIDCQPLIGEEK